MVATCLSEHIENIEKTFYLPSRIARILTGITYGDGYEYINDNNELVICFDKYEVGPGSTGLAEFVIPKEITSKLMK